jgi:hypothetical protein
MFEPITNTSYENILLDIANFVGCNLKTRKQTSTGNEYFNITASSRKSLSIILKYFNDFPLYSSKFLDYNDWKHAVDIILDNKHYSEEGINKIDSLKNSMNLKRVYFN